MREFLSRYLLGCLPITLSVALTGLSIWGAIATGGLLRIFAIIISIPFGVWLIFNAWRIVKMLRACINLLSEQYKTPGAFLFLFMEDVILLPRPSWEEKSRPTLFISFGIVSCLLRELELSNAKMAVQIPGVTDLEIPMQGTKKIKKLGLTQIRLPEFALLPDVIETLENLYNSGQTRIDFTAQLVGCISKEQKEPKEIARVRHIATARIQ